MKKVCVLGLGYIGLPTSVILAKSGFKVNGVDTNKDIVKGINNGMSHINEPGLEELIKKLVCQKVLFASNISETNKFLVCAKSLSPDDSLFLTI